MSQEILYRDVEIIIPINNWFDRHYMYALHGPSDKAIIDQAVKIGEDTVKKFNLRWDRNKPIRCVIYDQEENVVSYWINKIEKKIKDVFEDKNDETGTPDSQDQQSDIQETPEERMQRRIKEQQDSRTTL